MSAKRRCKGQRRNRREKNRDRRKKKRAAPFVDLDTYRASGTNVRQRDPSIPKDAAQIGRLQYVRSEFPYSAERVAQSLRYGPHGLIFCDATVFLAPTDPAVWRAMTVGNTVAITPHILGEILPWLEDSPSTNATAHAAVSAAFQNGGEADGVKWIAQPQQPWIAETVEYYANLLGVRKLLWDIAAHELTDESGSTPSNQDISNFIQKFGGPRAQLLARQGKDPKVPDNVVNDEFLVALALVYAITSGIEVTLVTSDEAVLDQFLTASMTLTRHYQAMHVAERYAKQPNALSCRTVERDTHTEFFVSKEALYAPMSDARLKRLMPSDFHAVQIHCVLLQDTVSRLTFRTDMEMQNLLHVKHVTGGLNTDLLDGCNIHVDLPRKLRSQFPEHCIIANDRMEDPGGAIPLSRTDIKLTLENDVSFEEVRYVDESLLLLPPRYRGTEPGLG